VRDARVGIRLALGRRPRHLLTGVVRRRCRDGGCGRRRGAVSGYALARFGGSYFLDMKMPSAAPVVASAVVLLAAAVVASGRRGVFFNEKKNFKNK